MGQARTRFEDLLKREPRCIYCDARPTQIEHMPPRIMFRGKIRPKGLEFACCAGCNNGTSGDDLVAAFIAKIDPTAVGHHWGLSENLRHRRALEMKAPGVLHELFGQNAPQHTNMMVNGVLRQMVRSRVNGPLAKAAINRFCAKLGMALYRQHVGQALPLEGRVLSAWFLSGGINDGIIQSALSILPAGATLQQGEVTVADQFAYRFNTDERTVLAAFARFHAGLYVLAIASREPDRLELDQWTAGLETASMAAPGSLRPSSR